MIDLNRIRYDEILAQVDSVLNDNEKMSLVTHILYGVKPNFLIPAHNWALTRQGGECDVLTVNIDGTAANRNEPGTISFKEVKMPRSKLRGIYHYDYDEETRA